MFNPLDPAAWFKALFDFLLSTWTSGAGQSLVNAMQLLMVAPWPTFSGTFMTVWNSAFGLSLLVAVIVLGFNAIITAINYRHDGWADALKNVGWVLLNGFGLVIAVYGAMLLVDFANRMITSFTQSIISSDIWFSPFSEMLGVDTVDLWGRLGISWLGMAIGNALFFNALILQLSLIFFMLLYLVASSLGTGLISQIFRSAIWAALLTILFSRVIQILVLAFGAIALNMMGSTAQPSAAMAIMMLVINGIAVAVPYAMWLVIFISRFKKERRLDPVVIDGERKNKVISEENREEVASSRARNLTASSKSEKAAEFGSSALRVATHAATAFAIAKVAAMATAKTTAAIPEGSTKVIALTAAGIAIGAKIGESIAHKQIDKQVDKLGRPGASRARDLSGEG